MRNPGIRYKSEGTEGGITGRTGMGEEARGLVIEKNWLDPTSGRWQSRKGAGMVCIPFVNLYPPSLIKHLLYNSDSKGDS